MASGLERVAMYKALELTNRQQDHIDWRLALLEVLDVWLRLFPEVASKMKGRLSFRFATDAQPSAVSPDDL